MVLVQYRTDRLEKSMTYKTNWLRGLLGPMLVSYAALASAVPANIATGDGFHTAFLDNGAVFVMGENRFGQLTGSPSTYMMTPLFTGTLKAKTVSVNYYRTAILNGDGTISLNGIEWTTKQASPRLLSVNATDVALTMKDTFYVENGTLFRMIDGQGTFEVPGATNVKHVAAGNGHVVILFNDGTVGTYGNNWYGQIGTGTLVAATEVQRLNLTGIVEISAGEYVSGARSSTGEIFVWGRNDRGYLGTGVATNQLTPFKVPGVVGAKKLAVSRNHTSYIKSDGTLWVAGWHNYIEGALYNVNTTFVQMPIGTVKDISSGGDYIMVDRGAAGQREGWGGNGNGKLGDGSILEKHQITTAYFTPMAQPEPEPVITAPAPKAVVEAKPVDQTCSFTPFQKVSMTDILRCQIPMYTSMNACVKDMKRNKIRGAGQVCKNLIIPADRGQQEKAPGKK